MKLRILDNSVRLRLRRGEVAELAERGCLEARVDFGGGAGLVYRAIADSQVAAVSASFRDSILEVRVPTPVVKEWADGGDVSITGQQENGSSQPLTLLIEKDFRCAHHDSAAVDAYPNPLID
jgi:hypothetical protein